MDAEYAMVSTTFDAKEPAEQMARELVERRLAACVQMWPITSIYRWKGGIEQAEEVLLIAKTTADAAPRLLAHLRSTHPYELPELLVTPVTGGDADYLGWVKSEVQPDSPRS